MKRISGFMVFFAIACFSLNASCPYTTQPCKQDVQTVCPDYFKTWSEWVEFTRELDAIYCGTKNNPPRAEKEPETPIPAIP